MAVNLTEEDVKFRYITPAIEKPVGIKKIFFMSITSQKVPCRFMAIV